MTEIPDVIDVSSWRQRIDFEQVAAYGVKGVIVRNTVNHIYADLGCVYNVKKAKAAGLWVGGYGNLHYGYDALWQAECFCDLLQGLDFPPSLDLERTRGYSGRYIASASIRWLETTYLHTSLVPMIYTRAYWFNKYVGPWFKPPREYVLWVAHYTTRPKPYIPKAWKTWDLWQYSKSGHIPGVPGHCDLNRINPNGKLARLLQTTGRTQPSRDD